MIQDLLNWLGSYVWIALERFWSNLLDFRYFVLFSWILFEKLARKLMKLIQSYLSIQKFLAIFFLRKKSTKNIKTIHHEIFPIAVFHKENNHKIKMMTKTRFAKFKNCLEPPKVIKKYILCAFIAPLQFFTMALETK